jgi:uncharacterized circularly permuted ATP-grasp superfamily protein
LLDSVPLVVERNEWLKVGAGLEQRARVLDLFLEDCFGAQHALRDGVVAAELVLGNPSFSRACHGFSPLGGGRLYLYAADIARSSRGTVTLFSDRTAAPTGAGYALENRLVLARALSDLFSEYGVERLANFFGKVRSCLEGARAPRATEPRVVVLSAGAEDEARSSTRISRATSLRAGREGATSRCAERTCT